MHGTAKPDCLLKAEVGGLQDASSVASAATLVHLFGSDAAHGHGQLIGFYGCRVARMTTNYKVTVRILIYCRASVRIGRAIRDLAASGMPN